MVELPSAPLRIVVFHECSGDPFACSEHFAALLSGHWETPVDICPTFSSGSNLGILEHDGNRVWAPSTGSEHSDDPKKGQGAGVAQQEHIRWS